MGQYWAEPGGSRILNASRVDQSGADNANVVDWSKADAFIVAINIHSGGKDTNAAQYKLRWRDVTDDSAFVDLASTGEAKFGTTDLVNGAAILVGGRKCDTQGDTWQNGEEVEGTALSDAIDLPKRYETEIHFSVSIVDGNYGHEYAFDLYNNTEDAIVGAVAAQITVESIEYKNMGLSFFGAL